MTGRVIAYPSRDRVLILENKKAGYRSSSDEVTRLVAELASYGLPSDRFSDVERLKPAIEEHRENGRLRVVVAAGGDGTLQLLANLTQPNDPLTILPLGTENLAAKNFQIRRRPQQVCDLICRGKTQRFDAGLANERLFLVMLGCGFDATIVRSVHQQRKGHISKWTYALPILKAMREYRFPPLRIVGQRQTVNGSEPFERTSSWAFLFNLPRYASALQMVPQADATDGQLDLRTYSGTSLIAGMGHLTTVALHCQAEWNGAFHDRVESVTISAADARKSGEIPFQLDGDPSGVLPVTVRIVPQRLTIMLP